MSPVLQAGLTSGQISPKALMGPVVSRANYEPPETLPATRGRTVDRTPSPHLPLIIIVLPQLG
jgi:hypothetical protein